MQVHYCQGDLVTTRRDVRFDLIRAAERLFARHGVDAVSLRRITVEAGATNASAIQYHFGGRRGLLRAIHEVHDPAVERSRHRLLDAWEDGDERDLRTLAAAYVRPLADRLYAEGGDGYLQLCADEVNRPDLIYDPSRDDPADSTTRWRLLVAPLLDPDAVRLHRRFVAIQFTMTDLARRARNRPEGDHSRYISQLVDLVAAILEAPLSPETRRLTGS